MEHRRPSLSADRIPGKGPITQFQLPVPTTRRLRVWLAAVGGGALIVVLALVIAWRQRDDRLVETFGDLLAHGRPCAVRLGTVLVEDFTNADAWGDGHRAGLRR